MKYILSISVFIFSILLVLGLAVYIRYTFYTNKPLISPIPSFLTFDKSDYGILGLFWKPANNQKSQSVNLAETSKSALIYDLTDEKYLYSKNIKEELPMASLTKIMTAVVAMDNKKASDRYVVTSGDLVGENVMGLTNGEALSLEELLYGLVLPSGNDAAEVLASNYPGGRTEFIKQMNKKAKEVGMKNTNFTNPSGLQGDGDQYTTSEDLLVLTRYALKNYPLFAKVVATYQKELPATESHKYFDLYNETNLISTYPGVKGVKTGYTPEAGLCLVTYLNYGGKEYVGIILGSENRREEMRVMLDYALTQSGITPPKYSG